MITLKSQCDHLLCFPNENREWWDDALSQDHAGHQRQGWKFKQVPRHQSIWSLLVFSLCSYHRRRNSCGHKPEASQELAYTLRPPHIRFLLCHTYVHTPRMSSDSCDSHWRQILDPICYWETQRHISNIINLLEVSILVSTIIVRLDVKTSTLSIS